VTTAQPVTKVVHDELVAVLAELFGDSVHVVESPDPANGLVTYGYSDAGLPCTATVIPLNTKATSISVTVRLGRVFVGYRRALRWLAFNRASNTVGLMAHDDSLARLELWLSCNRVTLPGDSAGVKEMLVDVHTELERVLVGMRCWFPQMLAGGDLATFEKLGQQDGNTGLLAVISDPRGFLDWLRDTPDAAADVNPSLVMQAMGWLQRWEERLPWVDRVWEQLAEGDRTQAARYNWLMLRAVSLMQLGRGEELLGLARELQGMLTDEQWAIAGTCAAGALYLSGRYDEVAEELQGAQFDENPRAWYWRSLAAARLGNVEQAMEAFQWYQRGIGTDILGQKVLRELLPKTEEAEA